MCNNDELDDAAMERENKNEIKIKIDTFPDIKEIILDMLNYHNQQGIRPLPDFIIDDYDSWVRKYLFKRPGLSDVESQLLYNEMIKSHEGWEENKSVRGKQIEEQRVFDEQIRLGNEQAAEESEFWERYDKMTDPERVAALHKRNG